MKPYLTTILATLLAFTWEDTASANFYYNTNNGTLTLYAYHGSEWTVTIPSATNGLLVTAIGPSAFLRASVHNVTIPDSIRSIGDSAFNSSSIENLVIPDSVTNLGPDTCAGCYYLTNATIGNGVVSVPSGAFSGCPYLANVSIGTNVTYVGRVAFSGAGLRNIVIPYGVTTVGFGAFAKNLLLTSIQLPSTFTNIESVPFWTCPNLTGMTVDPLNPAYSSTPEALFNKDKTTLVEGLGGLRGAYTVPDSVTSIGRGAFYEGANLTRVTIGDSVTNLGDIAFYDCTALTNVALGKGLAHIGDEVFENCSSLSAISVDPLNPFYTSIVGALFTKDLATLIKCPAAATGAFAVPDGVRNITDMAFYSCTGLTSITLPSSVTNIGAEAFHLCSGLRSVNIPNRVTAVGTWAFAGCSSLTNLTIGAGVCTVGSGAFAGCSRLGSIDIPDSVANIGDSAFQSCGSLTNVTIGGGETSIGAGVFQGCSALRSVNLPNNITTIGASAFEYCTSLTNLTLGAGVTNIGAGAFEYCSGLRKITIPDKVTTLGAGAFADCTSLTNLTVGVGLTNIEANAFANCGSLRTIYFTGNAPNGSGLFTYAGVTIYYLPGTKGWSSTFDGQRAVLWNPQVQGDGSTFGVRSNRFGFTVTGASNLPVVVEASTNLAAGTWVPLETLNLTGAVYFTDPKWINYPARFYRFRAP